MPQHDVLIIGGGPSGLHLARLLAEKKLDVVVLEKKRRCGDNAICTGIVGLETFKEFDLPAGSVTGHLQAIRMVSASGQSIVYHHPEPFASVVDRSLFDRDMASRAVSAGAALSSGSTVRNVRIEADHAAVEFVDENGNRSRRTARLAVIATGHERGLHRQAGLSAPRRSVFAAQAEIPSPSAGETTIFIGKSVARGGFGWSVPAGPGRTKLGLLTTGNPREAFERFLKAWGRDLPPDLGQRPLGIKPIAQGMASQSTADRVLAVGEAAGQVKTTTGGGIHYGLLGARIAAETIGDGYAAGNFGAATLSAYERRWKGLLGKEIKVGFFAHRIYDWLHESQVEALFDLARTDGIIPLIQKEGRFDWQSGLIIDLIRRTSVFDFFRTLSKRPASLDRILN